MGWEYDTSRLNCLLFKRDVVCLTPDRLAVGDCLRSPVGGTGRPGALEQLSVRCAGSSLSGTPSSGLQAWLFLCTGAHVQIPLWENSGGCEVPRRLYPCQGPRTYRGQEPHSPPGPGLTGASGIAPVPGPSQRRGSLPGPGLAPAPAPAPAAISWWTPGPDEPTAQVVLPGVPALKGTQAHHKRRTRKK